jgi:hypothetical protein
VDRLVGVLVGEGTDLDVVVENAEQVVLDHNRDVAARVGRPDLEPLPGHADLTSGRDAPDGSRERGGRRQDFRDGGVCAVELRWLLDGNLGGHAGDQPCGGDDVEQVTVELERDLLADKPKREVYELPPTPVLP